MLNIFVAILPALLFILLFYLLNKDFVTKRWYILLLLLVIGALGSYVCYRFEMHYGSYFKKIKDCNYLEVLFYAVFGVAIFEEGYKWVVSTIPSIIDKCVDSLSIVTYSVFTSIGFALYHMVFLLLLVDYLLLFLVIYVMLYGWVISYLYLKKRRVLLDIYI